jgi:hypothetical protein
VRARLRPRARGGPGTGARLLHLLGRVLQVAGLMVTLVAATAFFGTPDTTAMLKMMLVGVGFFVPGWLLARSGPGGGE